MKKGKWRSMVQEIYRVEISPKLHKARRHFHPMEMWEMFPYRQSRLFRASRTIRYIEASCDEECELTSVFQVDHLKSTITDVAQAHHDINERILVDSGIVDVIQEYGSDIMSELELADLPKEDLEALRETGSSDPEAELRLRIKRVEKFYRKEMTSYENKSLRGYVKSVGGILEERHGRLGKDIESKGPSRRWFKGLGSICRGTVLTAVDVSLLGGWWSIPLSPDTTIVGAVGSITAGLGDIAVGVGELRGE